ncbi:hypothetical protein E4K10_30505 [Streptomyces sp. T1317-0309]|nr:hypothetical protein E4K10_30505 [Streptomyces sp. T1317-0309]
MSMFGRRRRRSGPPPEPDTAKKASGTHPRQGTVSIADERLPSRVSSVFFSVCITGTWSLQGDALSQRRDPAAVARHHLREQTRHTLTHYDVLDAMAAEDAVNVAITPQLELPEGLTVQCTAELAVTNRDRSLAEEHLRTEQRGDLERQETRRRITFLQRILADSDLRPVWWIDQYPERLKDFAQLEAAVKGLKAPHDDSHDVLRDEVLRFADQLLADIRTPQQREVFLRALTQTLQTLGSTKLQAVSAQWLDAVAPHNGSTPA